MNNIITNLTIQNLNDFEYSFVNIKKVFWNDEKGRLIHAGEFGLYRENLAKKWLKMYVPERLEFASGFVITSKNRISTQCDLILYDKNVTPKIENSDNQKFYPIETVAGVIEIKSDISSIAELNEHLVKLAQIKKLREDIVNPDPYYRGSFDTPFNSLLNPFDNIFTILICNKLKFALDINQINYGEISPRHYHNLILSLQDGLVNYVTPNGTANLPFSYINDKVNRFNFLKRNSDDLPNSIKHFITSLHSLIVNTCLHNIDMSYYLTENPLETIV